uniref:Zn(2)-C6 fungal-type domain-containing protein n=2 Tax=Bionectria ochroleuca TaxID=29856 RepID=A0A0B7JL26_BIOOC
MNDAISSPRSQPPETMEPATTGPPRGKRRGRRSSIEGGIRTSQACEICRLKKVKCDGQQPCQYCAKRRLHCVFGAMNKRKMFSVEEIRELKDKVAQYEGQAQQPSQEPTQSGPSPTLMRPHSSSASIASASPNPVPHARATYVQHTEFTPPAVPARDPGSTQSPRHAKSPTIAPDSALSSSDNFGSEIRSLLASRTAVQLHNESPFSQAMSTTSRHCDAILQALPDWPSLIESRELLDLVVLNVGISQQLFDVRLFSDMLSRLYQGPTADEPPSRLWLVEALLVMAVGRLLQAKPVLPGEDNPGASLFREATKCLPGVSVLKSHGILGIEVVALSAQYLQIVDRKDEAYVQASLALHLAVVRGMHKVGGDQMLPRSEAVHRNRLWWSIYMQHRRLAAAGGYPISLHDEAITVDPPSDFPGFPSSSAISMNVLAARITGQTIWTIYTDKGSSESSFVEDVQNIFVSIESLERKLPTEYIMVLEGSQIHVGGLPFGKAAQATARTSSSLYLSIFQAFIHAGRPILLSIARRSHKANDQPYGRPSSALRRLAEKCVEAASKSLIILQELWNRGIMAKHAFLDLDALFSAGFVFVLLEIIAPKRGLGACGLDISRRILSHLMSLGNRAASRRLTELNQMCAHLEEFPYTVQQQSPVSQTHILSQRFSFERGYESDRINSHSHRSGRTRQNSLTSDEGNNPTYHLAEHDGHAPTDRPFLDIDASEISLDGEDGIFWAFQPGMYTGEELADWEMFESQITAADMP